MKNNIMFIFENCDHITVSGDSVEIENLKFCTNTDRGISSVVFLIKNLDRDSQIKFLEGDLAQVALNPLKVLYISEDDELTTETFGDGGIKLDIKIA